MPLHLISLGFSWACLAILLVGCAGASLDRPSARQLAAVENSLTLALVNKRVRFETSDTVRSNLMAEGLRRFEHMFHHSAGLSGMAPLRISAAQGHSVRALFLMSRGELILSPRWKNDRIKVKIFEMDDHFLLTATADSSTYWCFKLSRSVDEPQVLSFEGIMFTCFGPAPPSGGVPRRAF